MGAKLDRNRPFGQISGRRETGSVHSFAQDGKKYDTHGDECEASYVVEKLPIYLLDPYTNHPQGQKPDKAHRKIIEEMKEVIKYNKSGLPRIKLIAMTDPYITYRIVDGYKRYHAFKELGYKEIECDVLDGGVKVL